MTTVAQSLLVAPSQLASSDTAVLTVASNTTAKVGRAVFTNTTGSAATITAGITTGGGLTAATTLISGRTVAPGEAYVSPELAGAVIPAGSQLRAYSSAATTITLIVSGLTIQ